MGSGVFGAFRLARYVSSFLAVPPGRFSEAFGVTDHTVPTGRPIGAGRSDATSGGEAADAESPLRTRGTGP